MLQNYSRVEEVCYPAAGIAYIPWTAELIAGVDRGLPCCSAAARRAAVPLLGAGYPGRAEGLTRKHTSW